MKVLFVNPPYQRIYSNVSSAKGVIPPLGIAGLAAFIRTKGYEVDILDANAKQLNIQQCVEYVVSQDFDVLALTAMTPTVSTALEIIEQTKKQVPEIWTVIGGAHASGDYWDLLASNKTLDFVIRGEGELSLLEMLNAISHKGGFGHIKGLGYRSGNELVHNEERKDHPDINDLPLPAYDLLPMEEYLLPAHHSGFGEKIPSRPFFMLFAGRGCPGKCNFCASEIIWGNKVRLKSSEKVLAEIDHLVQKYNVRTFDFADDVFTLNKKRLHEILNGLILRNYPIWFNCSSRVDTIDEYDLEKLKKAGCYLIRYGVESGDPDILKAMNKNVSLEDIQRTIKRTRYAGIASSASYVLGYPGESKSSVLKTIRLAKKLNTSLSLFFFAIPYKGTALYDIAEEKSLFLQKDFDAWIQFPDRPIIKTEFLDENDLIKLRKKAYRQVMLSPAAIWKKLIAIRDFQTLKRYVNGGMSILRLIGKS